MQPIVERVLGVLRLSCSSFRDHPLLGGPYLCCGIALRRDLLNSDDAKRPHLRIPGA
jgi:hypothetical protein